MSVERSLKLLSSVPWRSGLAALALVVAATFLFEHFAPLAPGNELEFPSGFSGQYCLVVEPEAAEAIQNQEGFLVYRFNATGVARSSTFPRGAGSTTRAVSVAPESAGAVRSQIQQSSCASWAFGDTTIVIGRVGASECKGIQNINATRAEALRSQCGIVE